MNIYEATSAAIERAGIAAYYLVAKPKASRPQVPDQYAVYTRVLTESPLGCDDADRILAHHVRVDVYDAVTPTQAVARLRQSLTRAGFVIKAERDLSEYEGEGYRVQLSCVYYEDLMTPREGAMEGEP